MYEAGKLLRRVVVTLQHFLFLALTFGMTAQNLKLPYETPKGEATMLIEVMRMHTQVRKK